MEEKNLETLKRKLAKMNGSDRSRTVESDKKIKPSWKSRVLDFVGCTVIGHPRALGVSEDFYYLPEDRHISRFHDYEEIKSSVEEECIRREVLKKTSKYLTVIMVGSFVGYIAVFGAFSYIGKGISSITSSVSSSISRTFSGGNDTSNISWAVNEKGEKILDKKYTPKERNEIRNNLSLQIDQITEKQKELQEKAQEIERTRLPGLGGVSKQELTEVGIKMAQDELFKLQEEFEKLEKEKRQLSESIRACSRQ